MTQREKLLVATIGAAVALLAAWWIVSTFVGAFGTRHEQLAKLQTEVQEKQLKVQRGARAKSQIRRWQQRSLSSDPNRAQTEYRVWLDGLAGKAGLEARPGTPRVFRDLYVLHTFKVSGEAELGKIIQFLHDFYNAGYLHRLSIAMNPQPEKKELQVVLDIDVLSLNSAPKEVDGKTPPPEQPLEKDVAAYVHTILGRNFFFPANNPPRLSSVSSQKGHPGKVLSFTVKGSDPDKSDRLTYGLGSPTLEGAKIDARSGEVRWTPMKLGSDYELVVRVTDDGHPPKSAETKVRIAVVEPPPPVKENPFANNDPARDAKVTALVGPPDNLQVWVTVLRGLGEQPRTLHLNAGNKISVGSFTGVVKEVRTREAVFELTDGRTVTLKQGQFLVSADKGSSGL